MPGSPIPNTSPGSPIWARRSSRARPPISARSSSTTRRNGRRSSARPGSKLNSPQEMRCNAVTVLSRALLCCAFVALATTAGAQTWPSRPVKLIVPTGPGAATDVMARLVADGVSRTLGQTMVVENMPGASGILAHQSVARAQADGYTLLFTNTSGMAINPISFKQLPYDPTRDFTAVALVCSLGPQMLSVNADLPVATVRSEERRG